MNNHLSDEEEQILAEFRPDDDLDKWAKFVNDARVYHSNTIFWNKPRRADGLLHASSLSNTCDRYLFLELECAQSVSKFPAKVYKIFDMGTAAQEIVNFYQETRATHHDYSYESEVKIGPETSEVAKKYRLCGSADGVSWGWPLERPVLWEYKTISLKGFQALSSVSTKYVIQMHVYMACLDIPVAYALYTCKNDTAFAAFRVDFSETLWRKLTKRIDRIIDMTEDFELPTGVNSSSCRSCVYFDDCEPDIGNTYRGKRKRF